MAKFGFSPLERAAEAAREDIQQRADLVGDAARHQKDENLYYQDRPLWHLALYAFGIVLVLFIYRNLPLLLQLLPMGLDTLKKLLPAGPVAEIGIKIIDGLPRFHSRLYAQVVYALVQCFTILFICFCAHGMISLFVSMGSMRFIRTLEMTQGEMLRRMNTIDDVKQRLKNETATGLKKLNVLSNIRTEAETLIKKSEKIICRNRTIKKIEVLLLTLASAGLVLYTLVGMHEMIITLRLQGRNEALLVTIVTIVTLAFYMCFIGKRFLPHYPKIGKWLLRLILLSYALWVNFEIIHVHQQSVDILAFFCLSSLPIPDDIMKIITCYASPILLSLLEIRTAWRIVKATNAASEVKADKEGISIPLTNGTTQFIKPFKARQLGFRAAIRPSIIVFLSAMLISYIFTELITDYSWLILGIMAVIIILVAVIIGIQTFSSNEVDAKYRQKASRIQGMFVLLFALLTFAMSPGNSLLIFSEDALHQMQEEQQIAQQQAAARSLSEELNANLANTATADRFSCDYQLVYTESGELIPFEIAMMETHNEISVDRIAMRVQKTSYYYDTYTEIQDYSWPVEGMENLDAYYTWQVSEKDRYVGYIRPDGSWADQYMNAGKWSKYPYYNFSGGYTDGWTDDCSYNNIFSSATEVEELGFDTVNGISTTHYMVKTKPQNPGQFDQWDNYGNLVATYYTAEEYYNAVINEQIKTRYAELYTRFMELVDQAYNQDQEIHAWFDDAGHLIKLERDWTYRTYRNIFVWGDPHAISQLAANGIQPLTNIQNYRYGDMAIPMLTIPDDVKELS